LGNLDKWCNKGGCNDMTLVCIDDDGVNLTCGEEYNVVYENRDYVAVVNDRGSVSEYQRKNFA